MASFFTDNDDLHYYLRDGIDWEAVVSTTELEYTSEGAFKNAEEAVAFYRDIASTVGEFVASHVAPHAAQIDREGIRFENGEAIFPQRLDGIFEKLAELGLHAMNLPRELGGMNVPMLLYFISCELIARADVSVMAHHGFHTGSAMAMLVMSMLEGSTEFDESSGKVVSTRWQEAISEIAAGTAWGSMDITEPDAGSDMAALRTTAVEDESGAWTVTGQKIFITSGHGKYHFVVARSEPDMPGLGGLSLFLVSAYRDEPDGQRTRFAVLDRLEEKLGHHGSATVAVSFDRAPAQLIGKRGQGFRMMLEFMNQARLTVGFESIGLCEAAVRMARGYAAERCSMGKPLERQEMIADYLLEMETDIVGLRALAMHAAFNEELGFKKALFGRFLPNATPHQMEREARAHRAVGRHATPLLKYLAAEKAVEMARRCLQIHGGNGYMKEFGAEKLLRDALVMPIYEGTSQIQALMAMKDCLTGVLKAPKEFVRRSAETRWRALSSRDGLERRVARLKLLSLAAQRHLITRSMTEKVKTVRGPIPTWSRQLLAEWDPKRDFSYALLHAERLTRLLADEAIVEALLAQARRHPERRIWLERYLERAEPRARFLHDEITTTGQRLVESLETPLSFSQAAS